MDPFEEYLLKKSMGLPNGSQLGDGAAGAASTLLPAATAASSAIPIAGLGLSAVGTALGAYGQYQDADEQKQAQERTQAHDWVRQTAQDAAQEEDRKRQSLLQSGNYADQLEEELLKNYGGYNARIGA